MRRFSPSMKPAQEPDTDFNEAGWQDSVWQEEQRQAADAAILLRVPASMKTALTIQAGALTAATGQRVSVNALVKSMITDALKAMAKTTDKSG